MKERTTLAIIGIIVLFSASARFGYATDQSLADPILVPQLGHSLPINSVAVSLDGRHVLTGSSDRLAKLWDTQTGRELRTYRGHTGKITCVAFSPNGKQLATGSSDKTA